MHLAYSAINNDTNNNTSQNNQTQPENETLLRYRAWQTTCIKYSDEIAAIQKYMPGWVPKLR